MNQNTFCKYCHRIPSQCGCTYPVKELIKEEDILDAIYVATKEGYGCSYLQGLNDGLEKARAILRKAQEK